MRRFGFGALALMLLAGMARAQLPGTAIDLAKLKIPETQKAVDLCPVHLRPSDPMLATWTHEGVTYRGCQEGDQAEFVKSPDRYVEQAHRQRWINNFMQAMSVVWCPVTDQITPGGIGGWIRHDLTWEVCCQFCEENITEQDFDLAFERLKKRAASAYELTGGRYVEGASSPTEGAIVQP